VQYICALVFYLLIFTRMRCPRTCFFFLQSYFDLFRKLGLKRWGGYWQ